MIIPLMRRSVATLVVAFICATALRAEIPSAGQIGIAVPWLTSERVISDLRAGEIPLSPKKFHRLAADDSLRAAVIRVLPDSNGMVAIVHFQAWSGRAGAPPTWLEGELGLTYRGSADGAWSVAAITPAAGVPPRMSRLSAAAWKERREVEEFLAKLRAAILDGDRATVAGMVRFPFLGHPALYDDRAGESIVRDRAELARNYDTIFSKGFRAMILRSLPWKVTPAAVEAADRVKREQCGEPGEYVLVPEKDPEADTFFRFAIRRVGGRLLLYRIIGCA